MTAVATTITVTLNGEPTSLPPSATIADIIQQRGIRGRYAVEVNASIVPRSAHAAHVIRDGDRIEVVAAIGGG